TWVNGRRLAKGEELPIGPKDKICLGGKNGPELNLSEYKPPAHMDRTLVDINIPPHRATYEGKEYEVVGIDRHSGDAILKNDESKHFAMRSRPVTSDELDRNYRAIEIEGRTYYRDRNDNVYFLLETNGKKQLLEHNKYKVVPTEKIAAP